MATFRRFEEIEAWQNARQLVRSIYEITEKGKFARDFGLRDQIRRAAVSVMANIAEGFERGGNKEFTQFLSVAKASCGEVRSHMYVALDLNYLDPPSFETLAGLAIETSSKISALIRYLQSSRMKGEKFAHRS